MPKTSDVPDPHIALSQKRTIPVPQTEPDRQVERICKAFIRLLTAPESEEDLAEIPTSSERSTTRVS